MDELIAPNHPVGVVNKVIDQLNIDPLIKKYKAGGTSSFHPRMLLKVLVFAYINNIYSSRKIEEALQQNIYFMWLSAMSTLDHNTMLGCRTCLCKHQKQSPLPPLHARRQRQSIH